MIAFDLRERIHRVHLHRARSDDVNDVDPAPRQLVRYQIAMTAPRHRLGAHDGDALLPAERVLFSGDILFCGAHPIAWAGPVSNWIAACERILAMDVDVIVPGHGPVTGKQAVRELRIVTPSGAAPVSTLSGGNQQKVVLAKCLLTRPKVLMLDEPTRGVDVGAKTEIYRLLAEAAAGGIAILVSSSETPELLMICDRILVFFRGRVTATLAREDANEAAIAHHSAGHQ